MTINGSNIYRRKYDPDPNQSELRSIDLLAKVAEERGIPLAPPAMSPGEAEAQRLKLALEQDMAPEPSSFGSSEPAGRPSWDAFFFQMAELASTMATCPRAHCGAVIVRHKRVLSLGFNGADAGLPHCPTAGEALAHHLTLDHCDNAPIHAEINAIRNAAGNVYGATIYVYGHYRPCPPCQAELHRVGITDIRHRPGPRSGPEKNWG